MVPVTGGDRNKFQNAEKHAQRNNSSSGSQKQAKNWDPSPGPPQSLFSTRSSIQSLNTGEFKGKSPMHPHRHINARSTGKHGGRLANGG